MINQYNIVWIVVDSVRHYRTEGDDRSRLDYMDEFAKSATEFVKVTTSAPSTVMSISAMMTSLPSYLIGRNYTDFRFDRGRFNTLADILKSDGWTSRALIMHRDIREKLQVFDMIPRKYWPAGFSHRNWWDNSKIVELLRNTLRIDAGNPPQPCFWFLDFNCRKDPKTGEYVRQSIEALEEAGYTRDNTVYILCSDHGYPDPSRGITPEGLKQQRLTHDVFMTDDNIRVPMFISFPGRPGGDRVETPICTLDLMPTLIDLIGVEVEEKIRRRWKGRSVLPLFEGDTKGFIGRKIRTDARFFGQDRRVSSLRDEEYKYVFHHDDRTEELIDVSTFSLEEPDISRSDDPAIQAKLKEFREAFARSESEAVSFQVDYTIEKLTGDGVLDRNANVSKAILFSPANPTFSAILADALRKLYPGIGIALVSDWVTLGEQEKFDTIYRFDSTENSEEAKLVSGEPVTSANLGIFVFDSDKAATFESFRKCARGFDYSKTLSVNLNMSVSNRNGQISRYLRTLYSNRRYYFDEPSLVLWEILRVARVAVRRIWN